MCSLSCFGLVIAIVCKGGGGSMACRAAARGITGAVVGRAGPIGEPSNDRVVDCSFGATRSGASNDAIFGAVFTPILVKIGENRGGSPTALLPLGAVVGAIGTSVVIVVAILVCVYPPTVVGPASIGIVATVVIVIKSM